MSMNSFSEVEKTFFEKSGIKSVNTKIPYITVDNFPKLGLLSALRFLEWVNNNPEGTISLPTGKTPEYFIKWTQYLLENWNKKKGEELRKDYGLKVLKKPDLKGLRFIQIDEFYPISSKQFNSFYYYVNNYYIKGFELDKSKAQLINSDKIPLPQNKHFLEIFPDYKVDLSLRFKECKSSMEKLQQEAIFMVDDWCRNYEHLIRDKGGIGFFLGGIGPDGHIAFNTRGSDIFSSTRLTSTNFETQAVAASDLGGMEISSNRLVITIGLKTITYNPESVAIIIAAGEAKAGVVQKSLEEDISNLYPATSLQELEKSRFYITKGAASKIIDSVNSYYESESWSQEKTEKAILSLCRKKNKYAHNLTLEDLKSDPHCKLIPDLNNSTVQSVRDRILGKIEKGLVHEENQTYYHTGPHHDDIMLGILPHIAHQLRSPKNTSYFSVLTSGFTAVTNKFVIEALQDTIRFIENDRIQMIKNDDFFKTGYQRKWDKDVYHYLNKIAAGEPQEKKRGLCHRIIRAIIRIYSIKNIPELIDKTKDILTILINSYDGEKNPPEIQKLKGMIREFEEELVWAHFGVQVKNIHHLRLGFYTGDIFTEQPEKKRDVTPILEMLRKTQPSVISLALDPEGSGPDTHYKVLQAIAEAIKEWGKEKDLSDLRIWGYRNVWFRFNPAEANVIVPVSLNSMAVLDCSFTNCYLSQVDAPFPSYELHGKFSTLAQKIWVEQLKDIQLLLGKDFFYQNTHPRIRACHGMLYFKEMKVSEFMDEARKLEKSIEGMA